MSKKTLKIGDFCRKQMMKGLTPKQVIAKAAKHPKGGKVNAKHIAWYAWDMRKESSNHYVPEDDLPEIYQS